MAMKISISKIEAPKNILSRLPRFNVDFRINNMKVEMLYTPVTETLLRVWKEKKGLVEVAAKQFSEFNKSPLKKPVQAKRKVAKKKTVKRA